PHQWKNLCVRRRAQAVVQEIRRRSVGQTSALRCSLVQQDPSRLESELHYMSALCPGKVIDQVKGLRWVVRRGGPGQRTKAGHCYSERDQRLVRRVIDRLIHAEL